MDSDVTTNLDSITDSNYTYDSLLDDSVVDSSSISSVDSSADSFNYSDYYLKEIYRDVHFGLFFLVVVFSIVLMIMFGRFIYNLLR